MKKFLSLVVAVALCLTFTACGKTESPGQAVDKYLKDSKSQAVSSIEDFEKGDAAEIVDELGLDDDMLKSLDDSSKEEMLGVIKKVCDFDYEITKEEITKENESAVVTVNITSYNLGEQFSKSISNLMNDAMSWAMSGKSEEEVTNEIIKTMFEDLNKAEKNYKKEVKFKLDYKDDKWIVDEDNDDFENAITGGMMDAADSLNSL